MSQLRITEIFHSLQGESTLTGMPTVFVRLTGCPLRCVYCDTDYAFNGGSKRSLDDIIDEINSYDCSRVCVTGGEPLAQPECHELLERLCDSGFEVSLETSGAMDIADVDSRVMKVMDYKTPASGEMDKNRYENFYFMDAKDQVKFVICDRKDYDWARMKISEMAMTDKTQVLISPSHRVIEPAELAQWILDDRLDVRMQIQLHKVLWGDKQGV